MLAVGADWLFQSSLLSLIAVAAVNLVVAVAVEGAAGVFLVFVAVGSGSEVRWGVFDVVEALCCVLERGS